ncbi:MAG: molybdate ABC transporter substrate-binding protein [Candidatus Binatia bacterium]
MGMTWGAGWRIAGAAFGLLVTVAAVRPAGAEASDVLVFAAASLKNALDDVNAQWARETGKRASISYAATSALAKQIESGAPADVFVSADVEWMDYLAERNLIRPDSRRNLLGNELVLIAPKDASVRATIAPNFPLASYLGDGRLALADTAAVPAGRYAKAALEALGVWPSVEGRIAQAENVRAVLLLVSRGEAPLGIVYQTDANADPGVQVLGTFPRATHPPIIYPVAITAGSKNPEAVSFVAFLQSPAARAAFEKQSFAVLN